MDDDAAWRCADPSCGTCSIHPAPGEDRATWLARVGALYRATAGRRPERPPRTPAPPIVVLCERCGTPTTRHPLGRVPRWCSTSCRQWGYRARKRTA